MNNEDLKRFYAELEAREQKHIVEIQKLKLRLTKLQEINNLLRKQIKMQGGEI